MGEACAVIFLLLVGVGGWVVWWLLQRPLPTDLCLCGGEYQEHGPVSLMGQPCKHCDWCGYFRPAPRPLPPGRYFDGW